MSLAAAMRNPLSRVWRRGRRLRRSWHRFVDQHRDAPDGYCAVHAGGRPRLARVVSSFDSRAASAETRAALKAAMDEAGVTYAVLRHPETGATILATDQGNRAALIAALLELSSEHEWVAATPSARPRYRSLASQARRLTSGPARFTVTRLVASASGRLLTSSAEAVTVEVWTIIGNETTERVDGGRHLLDTRIAPPNPTPYPYLAPATWAELTAGHDTEPLPHVFEITERIDAVYTWVDGTDPRWRSERDAALFDGAADSVHENATSESRFTDHAELKYSLRSLEMYANWVNRIHIVTAGQVPDWLDTSNPRINLVDHRDIFTNSSALPVFNSHAIESQLHHIPGLTERYLYINDDVFFGRPVRPELFFEANGLTRFFLSRLVLDVDAPSARDVPVLSAAKNNRALIEQFQHCSVTNKFAHTPHPQNRIVLEELEERFPDTFDQVAKSAFRHPADLSVASSLHHWYGYVTGRAIQGQLRFTYRDMTTVRSARDLVSIFTEPRLDVFCLNDTQMDPTRAELTQAILTEFLEEYFPVTSTFERPGAPHTDRVATP